MHIVYIVYCSIYQFLLTLSDSDHVLVRVFLCVIPEKYTITVGLLNNRFNSKTKNGSVKNKQNINTNFLLTVDSVENFKVINFNRVRASVLSNRLAKTASKSVHSFGWNFVHKQSHTHTHRKTDRHTQRQTAVKI